MARIFLALAAFAVLLLAANLVIGLSIGDYNGRVRALIALKRQEQSFGAGQGRGEEREAWQQQHDAALAQLTDASGWMTLHFRLGVVSTLVAVLVNCITVTYFVGTSRWCHEVTDTYGLDRKRAVESTLLKRRTFPWALTGSLALIGVACLGAVSDPSGHFGEVSESWVMPHFLAALGATAFNGVSFLLQVGNIGRNYELIEEILAEVQRVRRERGLPDE